jgi:hypothetical protein
MSSTKKKPVHSSPEFSLPEVAAAAAAVVVEAAEAAVVEAVVVEAAEAAVAVAEWASALEDAAVAAVVDAQDAASAGGESMAWDAR